VVQYFLSGQPLIAYQRLERVGMLLIIALVVFVRPVQSGLFETMLSVVAVLADTFCISPEVEFVLRRLLVS
jgi:hypothetical protein